MSTVYYSKTTLIGGAGTALDSIDGSGLAEGDVAYVSGTDTLYIYKLNATSGATESSPWIIAPDANAGTKRWILRKPKASKVINFSVTGTPTVADDVVQHLIEGVYTFDDVLAIIGRGGSTPSTSALIFTVDVNGTPAATGTINAGASSLSSLTWASGSSFSVVSGDNVSISVTQIGAGNTGGNPLVITIYKQ